MPNNTGIHALTLEGRLADIQALTAKDSALVNVLNDFNESPLILSLKYHQDAVTRHFLELPGIDFHQQSYSYGTALVAAVYFNRSEAIKHLIEKEKQANSGLFQPGKHPGLLLCAIRADQASIVELLIREGVDINDPGRTGYEEPPYGFDNEDEPTPFDPYGPPVFELPIIVALQDARLAVIPVLLAHQVNMNQKGTMGYSANDLIASGKLGKEVETLMLSSTQLSSVTFFKPAAMVPSVLPLSPAVKEFPVDDDDVVSQAENCIETLKSSTTKSATVLSLQSLIRLHHQLLKDQTLSAKKSELLEKMLLAVAGKFTYFFQADEHNRDKEVDPFHPKL